MLLLHGGSGAWSNYRTQVADLARDFQVFAPDMRGHGASPWPGRSSIHDFYSDLEEFAAQLPGPFFLVGHSFGGYMAVRLAASHPNRVLNLTLLNTAEHAPRGLIFRILRLITPLADHLARPEGKISTGRVVSEHLLYRVLQDWDCLPYYPKIRVPVLVIMGIFDPLIPIGLAWRSARRIPGSRIKILPLGFHVAMWDRPKLINRWLREHFLGR